MNSYLSLLFVIANIGIVSGVELSFNHSKWGIDDLGRYYNEGESRSVQAAIPLGNSLRGTMYSGSAKTERLISYDTPLLQGIKRFYDRSSTGRLQKIMRPSLIVIMETVELEEARLSKTFSAAAML